MIGDIECGITQSGNFTCLRTKPDDISFLTHKSFPPAGRSDLLHVDWHTKSNQEKEK